MKHTKNHTKSIFLVSGSDLVTILVKMMSSDEPTSTPFHAAQASLSKLQRQYQQMLDRWTPHVLQRWLATLGLLAVFMLRIVFSQGVKSISFMRRIEAD